MDGSVKIGGYTLKSLQVGGGMDRGRAFDSFGSSFTWPWADDHLRHKRSSYSDSLEEDGIPSGMLQVPILLNWSCYSHYSMLKLSPV